MARAALTKTTPTAWASDGTNLTDATYSTLSTGAGNGVTFSHDSSDLLVLKNDTGGAAAFTIIAEPVPGITAMGETVPDVTITIATAKEYVFRPIAGIRQTDGDVYIDCDVAGKCLVLDMSAQT